MCDSVFSLLLFSSYDILPFLLFSVRIAHVIYTLTLLSHVFAWKSKSAKKNIWNSHNGSHLSRIAIANDSKILRKKNECTYEIIYRLKILSPIENVVYSTLSKWGEKNCINDLTRAAAAYTNYSIRLINNEVIVEFTLI